MEIRHLRVENFRGTATLDWAPGDPFCCLIGPGDAGKSTVLDAVEAALSSRWLFFGEHDFIGGDASGEGRLATALSGIADNQESPSWMRLHRLGDSLEPLDRGPGTHGAYPHDETSSPVRLARDQIRPAGQALAASPAT